MCLLLLPVSPCAALLFCSCRIPASARLSPSTSPITHQSFIAHESELPVPATHSLAHVSDRTRCSMAVLQISQSYHFLSLRFPIRQHCCVRICVYSVQLLIVKCFYLIDLAARESESASASAVSLFALAAMCSNKMAPIGTRTRNVSLESGAFGGLSISRPGH